jgi:hypothetical protein
MNIEFSRRFEMTDNARLSQFEAQHGFRFPSDYRDFLLKHNGGMPVNNRFISKYFGPQNTFVVRRILPLADKEKVGFENLESVLTTLTVEQRRIPAGMVPIASDGFGNLFLIAVSHADTGKIFFWDHEREADPDDDEVLAHPPRNLSLVADTFTEFLVSLKSEGSV